MSIHADFVMFYNANPKVYYRLVELALQLKHKGLNKYSMKGLFEVIRWERALKAHGDTFKLNNNFTSWYARTLMLNEPMLKDFFETRELQSI